MKKDGPRLALHHPRLDQLRHQRRHSWSVDQEVHRPTGGARLLCLFRHNRIGAPVPGTSPRRGPTTILNHILTISQSRGGPTTILKHVQSQFCGIAKQRTAQILIQNSNRRTGVPKSTSMFFLDLLPAALSV